MKYDKPTKKLPPPIRKKKRHLSLKAAVAAISRSQTTIIKPLMDPRCEFPKAKKNLLEDMQANLIDLQADIIVREGLINDKETRLQEKELELNEREALLEAHRKILVTNSMPAKKLNEASGKVGSAERLAFETLKRELATQEESLKNTRKMLQERDEFIEQCENELVEKSMLLTEREARIEQREEDHEAKKSFDSRATKEQAS